MKTIRSKWVWLALGGAVLAADLLPGGVVPGGLVVKQAQAVVGRPLTPVSVAGVARRTTRRVVMTSTYVATLPAAPTTSNRERSTWWSRSRTRLRSRGACGHGAPVA